MWQTSCVPPLSSNAVLGDALHVCTQVESAMSVQNLKPTIDEIKRLYGEDKQKIQRETSALYEKSGVNPVAGNAPAELHSLAQGWAMAAGESHSAQHDTCSCTWLCHQAAGMQCTPCC